MIDDLWALAVVHLPALGAYERQVNDESELTGRNLEPWRAILAVAFWLEDYGVKGLAKRMVNLSVGYQSERKAGRERREIVVIRRSRVYIPGIGSDEFGGLLCCQ